MLGLLGELPAHEHQELLHRGNLLPFDLFLFEEIVGRFPVHTGQVQDLLPGDGNEIQANLQIVRLSDREDTTAVFVKFRLLDALAERVEPEEF